MNTTIFLSDIPQELKDEIRKHLGDGKLDLSLAWSAANLWLAQHMPGPISISHGGEPFEVSRQDFIVAAVMAADAQSFFDRLPPRDRETILTAFKAALPPLLVW